MTNATPRRWTSACWDVTNSREQIEAVAIFGAACGKLGLRHVRVFSADGADTLMAVASSRPFTTTQMAAYLKDECDFDATDVSLNSVV